ncbi:MAG: tetratricopeptide repeat protein [Myxococcales bacterium]|nr:tetratricopeptide repeat protein [Myxococcales bacterium]
MRRAMFAIAASVMAIATTAAPASVRADLASASKTIDALARELRDLNGSVATPQWQRPKAETYTRRLIDAQVAYGTGRFEEAAILLFDYMLQPGLRDRDVALYYLAESLYRRHDYMSAQRYFGDLVQTFPTSKHYQSALERLIELAVDLDDNASVTPRIAALDAIPADKKRPSAPYVRGKYAYATGNNAEALTFFAQVKPGSAYEFQARFFEGAVFVAGKELDKAIEAYAGLLKLRPRTGADRRIIELAQLALGRLYYEKDLTSAAVDAYLMIDRRSDLFSEALYEIAWVYIKAQEFEKALRALELLALTDPTSSRLPTVRILEANLRVRKAQAVRARIIVGVEAEAGNPSEEYDRAEKIFIATADLYRPAHDELATIVGEQRDTRLYLGQITSRAADAFTASATMPELAAAWVRDDAAVKRLTVANQDLGDIGDDLRTAEDMIARVDAALSAEHRVSLFPALAKKRQRALAVREELLAIYLELAREGAAREAAHVQGGEGSSIKTARDARQALETELAALPGSDKPAADRVAAARAEYDSLAQDAATMELQLDGLIATSKALRKYASEAKPPLTPAQRLETDQALAAYDIEIDLQRQELQVLAREIDVGRDQAGVSDEVALRRRDLIAALAGAYAAEFAVALPVWARASQLAKAGDIATRGGAAWTTADELIARIDSLVDGQLVEVRAELEQIRADLLAHRGEFEGTQGQSDVIGTDVLAFAFREVIGKFYEILVRSDVGVVDVHWSQREEGLEDLTKLTLERSRELKHLRDEFRDLIEEDQAAKAGEPTTPTAPAPGGEGSQP